MSRGGNREETRRERHGLGGKLPFSERADPKLPPATGQ